MKTVIYIENDVVQLVVTPQTRFEKNTLSLFEEQPLEVKIFQGSFYDCRGGWIKQDQFHSDSDRSIILTIKKSQKGEAPDAGRPQKKGGPVPERYRGGE